VTLLLTNPLNLGGTTDWTFHMVYKKDTHADAYYWFKGAVTYPRMEHRRTILQIRADGAGSPRGIAYTDNTDTKIMTITNNMSTGEFKLYINGQFIGEASSSAYYATNPLTYTIAQLYANGTTTINTGNVLFYTAEQTSEEVTLMTDWLNDKYNIY